MPISHKFPEKTPSNKSMVFSQYKLMNRHQKSKHELNTRNVWHIGTSWMPSFPTFSYIYMGVSKNNGTPKWMVKTMENPINPWMIWGENPLFSENTHIFFFLQCFLSTRLKIIGAVRSTRGIITKASHDTISTRSTNLRGSLVRVFSP